MYHTICISIIITDGIGSLRKVLCIYLFNLSPYYTRAICTRNMIRAAYTKYVLKTNAKHLRFSARFRQFKHYVLLITQFFFIIITLICQQD